MAITQRIDRFDKLKTVAVNISDLSVKSAPRSWIILKRLSNVNARATQTRSKFKVNDRSRLANRNRAGTELKMYI